MDSAALTQGCCQQERHYPVEVHRTFLVIGKGRNAPTLHQVLSIGELEVHEGRRTMTHCTDDPALFGRPRDFEVTVREIRISAGAGFLVPITGEILTMPGLPKRPNAQRIDVDAQGRITGLT